MFKNIGKKIKILAEILCIASAVLSVLIGFVLMAVDDDLIWLGLSLVFVGPLISWISSWLIYGFGELIDKVTDIEANTRLLAEDKLAANENNKRRERLKKLLIEGLITEEDYQSAKARMERGE